MMVSLTAIKDSISAHSTIGNYRNSNEDTFHIELMKIGSSELLFLGVFDGHGGSQCSNFLKDHITKYFQFTEDDLIDIERMKNLITSSCTTINQVYFSSFPDNFDGSCGLMVFIFSVRDRYHLLVANVGDSMGIISHKSKNGKIDYSILNRLHKPNDPKEKSRLEKSGFIVIDNRFLGLAVSRAFGDRDLNEKGITCKPEFRDYEITNNFQKMILASDGLWDVVNEDKVTEIIDQDSINSESLVDYALNNGSTDNVTVIICDFKVMFN